MRPNVVDRGADTSGSEPLTNRSDLELLTAATSKSGQPFRIFFERHVRAVHAFIAARVGPSDAEDLVAETFATAWKVRANFDGRRSDARAWLLGIATRVLMKHREREARWFRSITSAIDNHGSEGFRERFADWDPALVSALAKVTPEGRDVLLLTALGDLTTRDAASVLGISHTAARVRLHRATRLLKRLIETNGRDDE